jgi:hypothetical protein
MASIIIPVGTHEHNRLLMGVVKPLMFKRSQATIGIICELDSI